MVDTVGKSSLEAAPAPQSSFWQNAGRRLVTTRYVLAASFILFLGLASFGRIEWLLAAELCLAMVVIAAISPVRTARARLLEKAERRPTYDYSIANSMVDALREPLIMLDDRGVIQFATREALQRVQNINVGSSALLRFRSPEIKELIREALDGGSPGPVMLHERGENERFFQISAFRLPLDVGPLYRVCLYFNDATQERFMERMRSDFVANASHELRTPLASLTGYIETLAGPARDDKQAQMRFLPIMLEQTQRMSRLVNDLLHLSKYETARGISEYKPVDVRDALIHVSNAVKPIADNQNTQIELNAPEGAEGMAVRGDREELIQLFENLVENALKYGGEGRPIIINASSTLMGGAPAWKIDVVDQGPGIAPEHLPRLTERFYRVDVEESRGKQGTGLGLSIAKHVTTRHEGRLQINSDLGSGSTFSVLLPKLKKSVNS
ncbi:MAG: ATP-binding protein [Pseudomonadota bacterium]